MKNINPRINFCLAIAKFQTELSRRLDSHLGGLGFNGFIILLHLNQADEKKMRRIDLADQVGLTASGITRLLLPMEKIGLIKREASERDARVSFVKLASGGKTKLEEAQERMELFTEELIPKNELKRIEKFTKILAQLRKNI